MSQSISHNVDRLRNSERKWLHFLLFPSLPCCLFQYPQGSVPGLGNGFSVSLCASDPQIVSDELAVMYQSACIICVT